MGLCFLAPLFADIISNFSIRSSQYEVTSELQIKALLSLHVTQHISFTHHTASSSSPPRHHLVIPMMFLVLVCTQNLRGHCGPCLQSFFTQVVKKFCNPSSFADPESCHLWLNLGATTIMQQDTSLQGRDGTW
jgi:hypothetical protein